MDKWWFNSGYQDQRFSDSPSVAIQKEQIYISFVNWNYAPHRTFKCMANTRRKN